MKTSIKIIIPIAVLLSIMVVGVIFWVAYTWPDEYECEFSYGNYQVWGTWLEEGGSSRIIFQDGAFSLQGINDTDEIINGTWNYESETGNLLLDFEGNSEAIDILLRDLKEDEGLSDYVIDVDLNNSIYTTRLGFSNSDCTLENPFIRVGQILYRPRTQEDLINL